MLFAKELTPGTIFMSPTYQTKMVADEIRTGGGLTTITYHLPGEKRQSYFTVQSLSTFKVA